MAVVVMAVVATWQWFLVQPWYIQAVAVLLLAILLIAVIVRVVGWVRWNLS